MSSNQLPTTSSANGCVFCGTNESNEDECGVTLCKFGMTMHHFCMVCQYCRKRGATVGCVIKNCRKTFHFGCGRQAGAMFQFFHEFRTYCFDHRPTQDMPVSDRLAFHGTANSSCPMCLQTVEARASVDTLRAPCCHNTWFHRNCIQKYASSAGSYFFKCPLCNDKERFGAEMLQFGIHIPDRDASWERETHAFDDLLWRYSRCDAGRCVCPQGRDYNGRDRGRWGYILCAWCGSTGSHVMCKGLKKVKRQHVCQDCVQIHCTVQDNLQQVKESENRPPFEHNSHASGTNVASAGEVRKRMMEFSVNGHVEKPSSPGTSLPLRKRSRDVRNSFRSSSSSLDRKQTSQTGTPSRSKLK